MEKSEALSYAFYRARRICEEYDYPFETTDHLLLAIVETIMDWTLDRLPAFMRGEQISAEISEAYHMLNSHPMFGLSLSQEFLREAFDEGVLDDEFDKKSCDTYAEMHRLAEAAGTDITLPIFVTAMLKYPTALIRKCVLREPKL